jgi:hypothetical protein
MSEIKELKERIKKLEHTVDLLVSDSSLPIIRTIHENNISQEEFNEIHDVFEKFSILLEVGKTFSKDEIINELSALECVKRASNPKGLAEEIIMNMGISNRWPTVYHHYVRY